MKIFTIVAKVSLTEQPVWLEEFFRKYNPNSFFHVTLKQPCFVTEDKLAEINEIVANVLKLFRNLNEQIVFDRLIDKEEKDGTHTIMLATKNSTIQDFQKKIVSALSAYKKNVKAETKEWEENFVPHLTIASDLDAELYQSTKKIIKPTYSCKGFIKEIILMSHDAEDFNATKKKMVRFSLID